jgi:hypothetical protein
MIPTAAKKEGEYQRWQQQLLLMKAVKATNKGQKAKRKYLIGYSLLYWLLLAAVKNR